MIQTSVFPPPQEPVFDYSGKPLLDKDGKQVTRTNTDFFGYTGFCCERTFRTDSVPMLTELIKTGIIDKTTRCIDNRTMIEYARQRGAKAVEAELIRLGW